MTHRPHALRTALSTPAARDWTLFVLALIALAGMALAR